MECAVVSEDLQILEFKKEAFCGRNEFKMDVQKLIWNHSNSIFGTIQTNSDMICIYYKNNGRVFREFSHFIADRNTLKKRGQTVLDIHWSGGSRYLLSVGNDGNIREWDLKHKMETHCYTAPHATCVAYANKEQWIAAGCKDGGVLMFHRNKESRVMRLLPQEGHDEVCQIQLSPFQANVLAVLYTSGSLRMWDIGTQSILAEFFEHDANPVQVCFSPINENLIITAGQNKIVFYDVGQKWCVVQSINVEGSITAMDFCHNGIYLAVGFTNGALKMYDLAKGVIAIGSIMLKQNIRHIAFEKPKKQKRAKPIDTSAPSNNENVQQPLNTSTKSASPPKPQHPVEITPQEHSIPETKPFRAQKIKHQQTTSPTPQPYQHHSTHRDATTPEKAPSPIPKTSILAETSNHLDESPMQSFHSLPESSVHSQDKSTVAPSYATQAAVSTPTTFSNGLESVNARAHRNATYGEVEELIDIAQSDITNVVQQMHVDMLRQFQLQQEMIESNMSKMVTRLDALQQENKSLQRENAKLRECPNF